MSDEKVNAVVKSPKKKSAGSKAKKPANHPLYSDMIKAALGALKERGGSSRHAILKYIAKNYKVGHDEKVINQHLKMSLRAGVKNGSLKQSKGTGASGSFRLGETAKKSPAKAKKVKKPKAAKPKAAKKSVGEKKAKKAKSPKKAKETKAKKEAAKPKKAATKPKKDASKAKKVAAKPKKAAPKPKKPTAKPKKAAAKPKKDAAKPKKDAAKK